MSARRKQDAVLRLLRGEDLELVSRELGVTAAELSGWRDQFLAAGEASLKSRPADARDGRDRTAAGQGRRADDGGRAPGGEDRALGDTPAGMVDGQHGGTSQPRGPERDAPILPRASPKTMGLKSDAVV